MRRTRFDEWPCPIARVTDLTGDWWTPLVMREAFSGRRRFDEFQTALDVPRAVLTARLARLCEEGLLERVAYQDRPVRHEYRLTAKGLAFWDVLAAMWRFGSDWMWPDGEEAPVVLKDRASGEVVRPLVVDERTGEHLDIRRLRMGRTPSQVRPAAPTASETETGPVEDHAAERPGGLMIDPVGPGAPAPRSLTGPKF